MTMIDICGYLWAAFFVVWVAWGMKTKATQTREAIATRLSHTAFTVPAFVLMFTHDVPGGLQMRLFRESRLTDIFGVVVTAAGIAFAFWARAYLGRNWSSSVTVKIGHELVRNGPYRWVRHPIYTGLILALAGTAIVRVEVRGLVAVVLAYVGFKIKSRVEERAMIDTFGASYEEYSRSTGAILPKFR